MSEEERSENTPEPENPKVDSEEKKFNGCALIFWVCFVVFPVLGIACICHSVMTWKQSVPLPIRKHQKLPPRENRKSGVEPAHRFAFASGDEERERVVFPMPGVGGYAREIKICLV